MNNDIAVIEFRKNWEEVTKLLRGKKGLEKINIVLVEQKPYKRKRSKA